MDMETGETIENTAPAAPPGVQKKVTSAPAARGASKPLLVAVAFIAVIAIFGCVMAVYAVTGNAGSTAMGAVSTQDFLAHKATTNYNVGAQRIIGTATHHLTMHPACMESAANHKVRAKRTETTSVLVYVSGALC